MSQDITHILRTWQYDPLRVNARKIEGLDGRHKVQMRIDLGVIQMEATGRPDGKRPHGMESLLEYYLARQEEHQRQQGQPVGFELNPKECEELREEGTQYYFRYLSLFHIGDYSGVARDTARNLRLFDLMRDTAEQEDDRMSLEQYRPYVIMMNTRARALMAMERNEFRRALRVVQEGISKIEEFWEGYGQPDAIEHCRELGILREVEQQILSEKPPTQADILQDELKQAIAKEDYERAAQIRDQLQSIEAING